MTFQHILKQGAEHRAAQLRGNWRGSSHPGRNSAPKHGRENHDSGRLLISSFCRNSAWEDQTLNDIQSHIDCMSSSLNAWGTEQTQVLPVFAFQPVSIKTIIHTVTLLVCSARSAVSRIRKRRHLFGQRVGFSLHRRFRRARPGDWHVDFEKPDVRTLVKARMYKVESSFTS